MELYTCITVGSWPRKYSTEKQSKSVHTTNMGRSFFWPSLPADQHNTKENELNRLTMVERRCDFRAITDAPRTTNECATSGAPTGASSSSLVAIDGSAKKMRENREKATRKILGFWWQLSQNRQLYPRSILSENEELRLSVQMRIPGRSQRPVRSPDRHRTAKPRTRTLRGCQLWLTRWLRWCERRWIPFSCWPSPCTVDDLRSDRSWWSWWWQQLDGVRPLLYMHNSLSNSTWTSLALRPRKIFSLSPTMDCHQLAQAGRSPLCVLQRTIAACSCCCSRKRSLSIVWF